MKVIIVGGVAGGATAAARIRRLDEHAEITVFERSGYISYANCGLPYYIGDVITDPEELTLQTPESFFKRFRINMKIHHEVISIHPDRKTVSVKNLENGEIFEENYDKLILSPGAKPTQPRLPGVGIDKLFTLRTVEDTFRIKEYINKNHPKSAILAGGGFIGLELAENLRELGMDVTIVQRPKQLMNPFDPDMASMIHNEMRKHGIKLVLGYTVEGFREKDNGVAPVPDRLQHLPVSLYNHGRAQSLSTADGLPGMRRILFPSEGLMQHKAPAVLHSPRRNIVFR